MKYVKSNEITSQLQFGNFKSILSMYLYTTGSLFLGFSAYLLITVNNDNSSLTAWSGEALFWFLIVFFLSLFVLFLPVEFFNSTNLSNSTFRELLSNIISVISLSLLFLIASQVLINTDSLIINELIKIINDSDTFIDDYFNIIFMNEVNSKTLIRFDKENFLLAGWISSDQYNNQVTFDIEINSINQMIDNKIFNLPSRN